MFDRQKLRFASFLYKHLFSIYRKMYFNFKNKKDKHHLKLIRGLIKPGSVALDIGANIGFFSSFLSDCVGEAGHVYCFEPDVVNFGHLKNELCEKKNVSLFQKAIASETGVLTLYTSGMLNVDHRTYKPEKHESEYTVEKISVDDFVKNKFKVDFIKMDIQGFEMEALQGMKQTFDANPELNIFAEFWPYGLKSAGSSAIEMFDYVTQLGFKIFKVRSGTVSPMSRDEVMAMKVEYFTDANVVITRRDLF